MRGVHAVGRAALRSRRDAATGSPDNRQEGNMAEIPSPDATPRERSRILSIDIRITYCHANGKQRQMVIDTTKVKGIAWDLGAHDSTLPGKDGVDTNPENRLRFTGMPEELGPCPEEGLYQQGTPRSSIQLMQFTNGGEAVCCWWDGVQWICPDEVE
jgi:hypothetical protein